MGMALIGLWCLGKLQNWGRGTKDLYTVLFPRSKEAIRLPYTARCPCPSQTVDLPETPSAVSRLFMALKKEENNMPTAVDGKLQRIVGFQFGCSTMPGQEEQLRLVHG